MKYLIELKYMGTRYHGFQYQIKYPTIQSKLMDASNKLFDSDDAQIIGCSRTDSGVSANQYYAVLTVTGASIDEENIPKALNTYLPDDIAVYNAKRVNDEYNLHEEVIGKKYIYSIQNDKVKNPFCSDRTFFYPKELNIEKMNEACKYIIGKHDFKTFMASGSDITDTVRTVYDLHVEQTKEYGSSLVNISITGDGFLYNMVRIISGTLVEVSEGKIEPSMISEIIKSGVRKKAGRTLPGQGLRLERVYLKGEDIK